MVEDMLTETMFALGRRYALSGRQEQEFIIRDAMGRMNHWVSKEGDDMLILFSCFVEGARSAERDYTDGDMNDS
jgi:hypothetical protein